MTRGAGFKVEQTVWDQGLEAEMESAGNNTPATFPPRSLVHHAHSAPNNRAPSSCRPELGRCGGSLLVRSPQPDSTSSVCYSEPGERGRDPHSLVAPGGLQPQILLRFPLKS